MNIFKTYRTLVITYICCIFHFDPSFLFLSFYQNLKSIAPLIGLDRLKIKFEDQTEKTLHNNKKNPTTFIIQVIPHML